MDQEIGARFDDVTAGRAYSLVDPVEAHEALSLDHVSLVVEKAVAAARRGLWVAGTSPTMPLPPSIRPWCRVVCLACPSRRQTRRPPWPGSERSPAGETSLRCGLSPMTPVPWVSRHGLPRSNGLPTTRRFPRSRTTSPQATPIRSTSRSRCERQVPNVPDTSTNRWPRPRGQPTPVTCGTGDGTWSVSHLSGSFGSPTIES